MGKYGAIHVPPHRSRKKEVKLGKTEWKSGDVALTQRGRRWRNGPNHHLKNERM